MLCETSDRETVNLVKRMSQVLTRKVLRAPFEFERDGPLIRRPGGHQPDFSLSVVRQQETLPPITNRSVRTANLFPKEKSVILDTLFIVNVLGTSGLESVKDIDASSRQLTGIDLSALREISSVVRADFSDNKLPLEPFAVMASLEIGRASCRERV
jgi:hypothetical protein